MGQESGELSTSAQRVQAALDRKGVRLEVVELPASTRTAKEAAQAVGCEVGQIAKSLVFRSEASGKPVLVIASGSNRVDERLVEQHVGERVAIANAEFVREATGFAIGGVPPIGHKATLATLIDEDLLEYEEIWAAAGTPHAVFKLQPDVLAEITDGVVIQVARR
ncbi:MAG: YbaK/EbsC family protein [Anaerolineales bacterium]|jgi:prolyl-tRNA editing enzyme YbaK/EbsC (Cys-tRNA(Pro) deacylase)